MSVTFTFAAILLMAYPESILRCENDFYGWLLSLWKTGNWERHSPEMVSAPSVLPSVTPPCWCCCCCWWWCSWLAISFVDFCRFIELTSPPPPVSWTFLWSPRSVCCFAFDTISHDLTLITLFPLIVIFPLFFKFPLLFISSPLSSCKKEKHLNKNNNKKMNYLTAPS